MNTRYAPAALFLGFSAVFVALFFGIVACAPDTSVEAFDTTAATSKADAQKILQTWVDNSPSNNDGHSKIVTFDESDMRWSVFVTANSGAPQTFQCVAITSAQPTMFTYSEFVPTGEKSLLDEILADNRPGACDEDVDAITQPLSSDERGALDADWQNVVDAINQHRETPYSTIERFQTHLADYHIKETMQVSATETRFRVIQTSSLVEKLGSKHLTREATIIVPDHGSILLLPLNA